MTQPMIGSSDNPILLLDDDLPSNIMELTGVRFEDIRMDWEEFESMYVSMMNDSGFEEIDEAAMLKWCDEVEEAERRRILREYTDSLDGVDMNEFFREQEEQERRRTYVDTIDDVEMDDVFCEW